MESKKSPPAIQIGDVVKLKKDFEFERALRKLIGKVFVVDWVMLDGGLYGRKIFGRTYGEGEDIDYMEYLAGGPVNEHFLEIIPFLTIVNRALNHTSEYRRPSHVRTDIQPE